MNPISFSPISLGAMPPLKTKFSASTNPSRKPITPHPDFLAANAQLCNETGVNIASVYRDLGVLHASKLEGFVKAMLDTQMIERASIPFPNMTPDRKIIWGNFTLHINDTPFPLRTRVEHSTPSTAGSIMDELKGFIVARIKQPGGIKERRSLGFKTSLGISSLDNPILMMTIPSFKVNGDTSETRRVIFRKRVFTLSDDPSKPEGVCIPSMTNNQITLRFDAGVRVNPSQTHDGAIMVVNESRTPDIDGLRVTLKRVPKSNLKKGGKPVIVYSGLLKIPEKT